MHIVTMIVTVLVVAVVMGATIFGLLVYPIWMLIHCATDESRSKKSKIVWIIVILLAWLTGALAYGLFASRRKLFQWMAGILLVLGVMGVMLFGVFMNYVTRGMNIELTDMLSKVDTIDTSALTPEQVLKLKSSLLVVKQEMNSGFLDYDKKRKAMILTQLFGLMEKDSTFTATEYREWMDKYLSRTLMDAEALEEYVKQYERSR